MNLQHHGTDEEIARELARALAQHPALAGATITPLVKEGHVTLSGTVRAWQQVCDASRAARLVKGVQTVTDTLGVEPPENERRTDAELASAAIEALNSACMVFPRADVRVSAARGVVTLEGTVPYVSQRYDAEQTVERLRGLRGLINLIRVAPIQYIDLEQARIVVINALRRHALQDSLGIGLSAAGATLRLQGELDSPQEKTDVLAAARSIPGVEQLVDELVIRSAPENA